MSRDTALLLIAHGSRQPEANADLHALADRLRATNAFLCVEPSFLELASPTILDSGSRCVDSGAKRVVLVPYFLSAGVHVRRDLADYRDQLASFHPETEFVLAEPLGPHPLLDQIVVERAAAAAQASVQLKA